MTTIDANPYAWPWDGDLSPARLALVIAGAQQHWHSCTTDAAEHLGVASHLAATFRTHGALVVWVRHGRRAGSRNSIPEIGTPAWSLVASPAEGDLVVDAAGHDGCYGSALEPSLRAQARDQIVLCGLGLEGPVHSTLRSLNDMGYECLTLTDACAPYDVASGASALSSITFSFGIFGAIAPSASLVGAFETEAVR
jgi:nicotinamidase-related amidase